MVPSLGWWPWILEESRMSKPVSSSPLQLVCQLRRVSSLFEFLSQHPLMVNCDWDHDLNNLPLACLWSWYLSIAIVTLTRSLVSCFLLLRALWIFLLYCNSVIERLTMDLKEYQALVPALGLTLGWTNDIPMLYWSVPPWGSSPLPSISIFVWTLFSYIGAFGNVVGGISRWGSD